jgi:hypothetical protein
MTTGVRFNSGRSFFVGYGTPVPIPIELDPTQWEGAMIYASDREIYYSDGDDWVVISGAPIRRPFALEPITPTHFRQMRLSAFSTAAGASFTQTGMIFRVSLNPDMTSPILNTSVATTTGNSFTFDIGFLPAGTTFYWEGKYTATDNQESQFSKTFAQVFPALVDTPIPLIDPGAVVLALAVGPYGSAFEYTYANTNWEVYTTPTGGGSPLLAQTNTATSLNLGTFQTTVVPGNTYYWRARFATDAVVTSAWSELQSFVMDTSFLVLDGTSSPFYVGRTIRNSFNDPYTVPATVLSSDGTAYVCP